jgi:Rieske Fe-S protein
MASDDVESRDTDRVDRRGFLGYAAIALTGLVAIVGAAAAAAFLAAPALKRDEEGAGQWTPVDGGEPKSADAPERRTVVVPGNAGWATTATTYGIFVDAKTSGEPVAFSARCPHEGCQVGWSADRSIYLCPCHDSSWTREGERLGGPTKRGLDPLELRTRDGKVEVRYVTFLLDTPTRVPVA